VEVRWFVVPACSTLHEVKEADMTYGDERTRNYNAHTYEELAPYIGQHVAWSEDCKRILFADPVFEQLLEKVKGLDPATYIFDYFPLPPVILRGKEMIEYVEAEYGGPLPPDALLPHAIRISESADYPLNIQLANDHPGTTDPVAERVRTAESDNGRLDAG
jgi:hypothetical protein